MGVYIQPKEESPHALETLSLGCIQKGVCNHPCGVNINTIKVIQKFVFAFVA